MLIPNFGSGELQASEVFDLLRGVGQPALFVEAAVLMAAPADAVLSFIHSTVFARAESMLPTNTSATRRWLTMYRRHRVMQGSIGTAIGLESSDDASAVLDGLRDLSRATEDEIAAEVATITEEENWQSLAPFMGVPFPPDDATLRRMLAELDSEDDADNAVALDAFIATTEGRFYLELPPCVVPVTMISEAFFLAAGPPGAERRAGQQRSSRVLAGGNPGSSAA